MDEFDERFRRAPHFNQATPPRSITGLVQQLVQLQQASSQEAWFEVYRLLNEGVILPLPSELYNNASVTIIGSSAVSSYVLSEYGRRFITSNKEQADPFDSESVLRPLRDRNIVSETVDAYITEAARALSAQAYRGVVALVGVAAEAVSEDLYDALRDHLPTGERDSFLTALNEKKNSAEARWNAFRKRFPAKHAFCLGDELSRRFENVLEPQMKLFKQNRDDAAHRRATLIGPETAAAALTSFVPYGITAADVIDALGRPCSAPRPADGTPSPPAVNKNSPEPGTATDAPGETIAESD